MQNFKIKKNEINRNIQKNSIILSVREKEGKRLATIEWSVEEGKIWQIRARKNGIVKREKEIRSIVEKNKEKLIL